MDTHHQSVSPTFPSRPHLASLRQNLRKGGSATLSVPDKWLWHAYDYGFRRVVLGDMQPFSPIDALGEWFTADLVEAAEKFYRTILGNNGGRREYESPARKPPEDFVRSNWRQIRSMDLTTAEHELADPSIARMLERVNANLKKIAGRASKNKSDLYRPRAVEQPTMPLRSEDDPEVQRLLAEMGA